MSTEKLKQITMDDMFKRFKIKSAKTSDLSPIPVIVDKQPQVNLPKPPIVLEVPKSPKPPSKPQNSSTKESDQVKKIIGSSCFKNNKRKNDDPPTEQEKPKKYIYMRKEIGSGDESPPLEEISKKKALPKTKRKKKKENKPVQIPEEDIQDFDDEVVKEEPKKAKNKTEKEDQKVDQKQIPSKENVNKDRKFKKLSVGNSQNLEKKTKQNSLVNELKENTPKKNQDEEIIVDREGKETPLKIVEQDLEIIQLSQKKVKDPLLGEESEEEDIEINQRIKEETKIRFENVKDYVLYFSKLIDMEFTEERSQIVQKIRSTPLNKLEIEGISLSNLIAKRGEYFYQNEYIIIFSKEGDKKLPNHKFMYGSTVVISNTNASPLTGSFLEGLVIKYNEKEIYISVKLAPMDMSKNKWRLDIWDNMITHERMKSALQELILNESIQKNHSYSSILESVIDDNTTMVPFLFGQETDTSIENPVVNIKKNWKEIIDENTNESIMNAIENTFKNQLTLIQGPPGTGKSTTAIKIIQSCEKKFPILLTAFTNVAVDNLIERLIGKGIKALRIGPPTKIQSSLIEHSLEYSMEQDEDHRKILKEEEMLKKFKDSEQIKRMKIKIDKMRTDLIRKVIQKYDVICSTCVSIGHKMYQCLKFPFVIIDECTQSIEPGTLIPIMKGCKHLVLIGDHHQLAPTILSQKARDSGLDLSLFERLVLSGIQPHLLNVQYRMHPAISRFPSLQFYKGEIMDGLTKRERPWKNTFGLITKNFPISFYDLDLNLSKEEDSSNGTFKMNKGEVTVVSHLIHKLIEGGAKESEIGVISPYNGQVALLRQKLQGKYKDLEIKTVDGFQGREKEIIVLSLVRSNKEKQVGFLNDWRRMNVSITRARRALFLVGNRDTISDNPNWKDYFDYIEEKGGISLVINLDPVTFL